MDKVTLSELKATDRLLVKFSQPSEQSVELWCSVNGIENNAASVSIEQHQECHIYWYVNNRRVSALVRLVKSGDVTLTEEDLNTRVVDAEFSVIKPEFTAPEAGNSMSEIAAFAQLITSSCDVESINLSKIDSLLGKLKAHGLDASSLLDDSEQAKLAA